MPATWQEIQDQTPKVMEAWLEDDFPFSIG